MNDGSTDSNITEEEVVFALFLKESKPTFKYLSTDPVKIADAPRIVQSIEDAFERIGNKYFTDKFVGINVDGAGVNLGKHRGVRKLVQEKATWLQVIHCFNHRVELALKNAFKITAFEDINTMLCKLYYLYQKSAKCLSELRSLSETYDKTILKPMKASGIHWIDRKWRAMEIDFKNYGAYIRRLEQLSFTDSQALKQAKIEGHIKKWKQACCIVNIAIYLNVLSPIKRLAL